MSDTLTRIMVVDGSSVSRAILARILRSEIENVEVITCESGHDAVAQLKNQHFDLVTTALLLSDMDGLALSRAIRDTKRHHYTPVIVVSGDADIRLLKEGFESGVTDYFDKSNGYKAFGDFIKSFIQRNTGLVGHILYVEDSRTAAAVTRKILEKHGLKVTLTDNAEQAIVLLDNQGRGDDFDMVITDFFLEGALTGGDLLHAIRARLHLSQQELPVLVLTGSDDKQKQVEVFHAGGNDFVGKPLIEEVLIARVRSLLLIKHQYDALKQQAEAMRWIAATDSLTGVRSKRYLVDNGESYIRDPAHQPVWAMLIDIDHFKTTNDTLGHITGDHVLAELGETLNQWFPNDMVVRFGGEEFCVLVKQHSADAMLERAELLRQHIQQLRPAGVDTTVSLGLASTEDHPDAHLNDFLSKADEALYHSKERGRNRASIFTSEGPQESPWNYSNE
ncbi:response regulator [Thiohalophilus sp.]|uniref:response regulator n=1 Tax=Thiohalophilus sp. TaxID=3028392 RepID=UPI002ACDA1FB|nr:response regulator [Thiohalophilus sp.]MDZ7661767.1 response regulator [Thiohalophilus sp.]